MEKINKMRCCLVALIGCVAMIGMGACSAGNDGEKAYYGFEVKLGKSVGELHNVKYHYGDLGWRDAKIATPPGSVELVRSLMTVPETFEVSWDNEDGQHYAFTVPVRSKIAEDLNKKKVVFVIMEDHVEGYVSTPLPNYRESRERFY